MHSSSATGRRNVIAVIDGFRFAKRTRSALLQSIYSLQSWVSQNCRSSASLRNFGIDLSLLFITQSLLTVHSARRNNLISLPPPRQRQAYHGAVAQYRSVPERAICC